MTEVEEGLASLTLRVDNSHLNSHPITSVLKLLTYITCTHTEVYYVAASGVEDSLRIGHAQ